MEYMGIMKTTGQMTPCHAKNPETCRYHTQHQPFDQHDLDSFNERIIAAQHQNDHTSFKKKHMQPSIRLDDQSTRKEYFTIIGSDDRTINESYGRDLAQRLLPGSYRSYMYDPSSQEDVAVILHMDDHGQITSDIYSGHDKSEVDAIPIQDASVQALAFTDHMRQLSDRVTELASRQDENDQSVYSSVSADLSDLVNNHPCIDISDTVPIVDKLVDLRDQYHDAGDDADFDGDHETGARYHASADMIEDILPTYLSL